MHDCLFPYDWFVEIMHQYSVGIVFSFEKTGLSVDVDNLVIFDLVCSTISSTMTPTETLTFQLP